MQVPETADTKGLLLQQIVQNPGIRYRELMRLSGLANGVLAYHLSSLERSDLVKVDRKSRMTRYYPLSISDDESAVLKYIRHEPIRKILLFIFDHELCTFSEIVEYTGKAPSTISLHLKRLKEGGIVIVRHGEYRLYRLADRELVADVLSKYKSSFVDRLVDSYAETVEEL
ncbi:MAG TPA: winged helix-turn-helix transcriptional regulator [Nitrososphaera sp.]